MQALLPYHLPGHNRRHAIVCCCDTSLWRDRRKRRPSLSVVWRGKDSETLRLIMTDRTDAPDPLTDRQARTQSAQ